ncbi:MAG: LysR family transcriptional regulator [Hyphomicrobium sp.]
MNVFIAAAGAGTLSAAARQLGQPLTTVSRQLADLEAHVGAVLIARTTRTMSLTDAGRAYLETCRRVLDDLDAAERQIAGDSGGLAGEVALTAPVLFGRLHVLPIVAEFMQRHPGVSFRFSLVDRVVDLAEEGLDAAVRIGALPDSSLIATKVGLMRYVTCASPAYIRKHGAPETPKALTTHACVAFSSLPSGARWVFKSVAHGRIAVRIAPRLAVNTVEAAIDAASAGAGVTRLLSYQAEAALARKRLTPVLAEYDDADVPIHLVQRSLRLAKPYVRAFATFAAEALRNRLEA